MKNGILLSLSLSLMMLTVTSAHAMDNAILFDEASLSANLNYEVAYPDGKQGEGGTCPDKQVIELLPCPSPFGTQVWRGTLDIRHDLIPGVTIFGTITVQKTIKDNAADFSITAEVSNSVDAQSNSTGPIEVKDSLDNLAYTALDGGGHSKDGYWFGFALNIGPRTMREMCGHMGKL